MRRMWEFTDRDNTNAWVIPNLIEEELSTPYRVALLEAVAADGAFDLHGDQRAPEAAGHALVNCKIIAASASALQTAIDNMRNGVTGSVRNSGLRKLWRYEVTDESGKRWSFARASARPGLRKGIESALTQEVELDILLPDPRWYDPITTAWLTANGYTAETLSTTVVPEPIDPDLDFAVFTIAATPYTFTLTNSGDLETQRVIFYLVSQAVNGFTNPQIENLTTGQSFSSTTDGGTTSTRLSINASVGLGRAQKSLDAGVSWTDDTPALSLGATQGIVCELQPGANSMRYTDGGTPNLKLYAHWYHTYRD